MFFPAFISLLFLPFIEGNSNSIPSVIVFGDSTVDPGNNNFIKTLFSGNFPPYGVDFENSKPTGRFSNGKLTTDFVASYLGIKTYIPPYLDPNLSLNDLMTGVSFASAGSGYDPLTSTTNVSISSFSSSFSSSNVVINTYMINLTEINVLQGVISMEKQLEYFAEYKERLARSIGTTRTMEIIKKAVYIISCGSNDFLESRPLYQDDYEYQLYILSLTKEFIKGLLGHGAQKVAIAGIPPIGCVPIVITQNSAFMNLPSSRNCIDSVTSIAVSYNRMLQGLLNSLDLRHVIYIDIYTSLFDQVHHPQKYGFEVVNRGCCGTGLFEEGILCNHKLAICEDRSKYTFWDAIHPSERSYFYAFLAIRPAIDAFTTY